MTSLPVMQDSVSRIQLAAAGRSPVLNSIEELCRVAVLEAQASREAGVLHAGADVEALRGIEAVTLDEHDAETRQRLAAPADRWSRAVRAVFDLDRHAELRLHPRQRRVDLGDRRGAI